MNRTKAQKIIRSTSGNINDAKIAIEWTSKLKKKNHQITHSHKITLNTEIKLTKQVSENPITNLKRKP